MDKKTQEEFDAKFDKVPKTLKGLLEDLPISISKKRGVPIEGISDAILGTLSWFMANLQRGTNVEKAKFMMNLQQDLKFEAIQIMMKDMMGAEIAKEIVSKMSDDIRGGKNGPE